MVGGLSKMTFVYRLKFGLSIYSNQLSMSATVTRRSEYHP